MESAAGHNPLFSDLDRLADYLSHKFGDDGSKRQADGHEAPTGTVDPKRYPIVLVPGFLGWASPVFGFNYFGGVLNIAEILAKQGWSVVCPQVGPVSSNWERACELYSQLSHGSMDGKTYDIIVDYGAALPDKNVFYADSPPRRRQAACFNIDPSWRWGPKSPVHFIAHSQGGNSCRYLIHLLERGFNVEGSRYFTEPKKGWVKSLTTLATPHNGSSIIDILGDLGDAEDILLDQMIVSSAFQQPSSRIVDFCLDHRGLFPPTSSDTNLLAYTAQMTSPTGAYTLWRASTYTGFHDNSIRGIAGDLNIIIGSPCEDVYYFTLCFAATIPLPKFVLGFEDMLALPNDKFAEFMGWVGEWKKKFGEPVITQIQTQGSAITKKLPIRVRGLFSRLSLSSTSVSSTSAPTAAATVTTTATNTVTTITSTTAGGSSHTSQTLPTSVTTTASAHTTVEETNAATAAKALQSLFGSSLQDLSSWANSRINSRLPRLVPRLPSPGTTIARIDLFPGFLITAPGMCAFKLSSEEREIIKRAGGPTRDEDWHEHDGVVPTCSQAGPWGSGNRVVTVEEIVRDGVGVSDGGRGLKGIWVNLGKSESMDHADCIGSSLYPATLTMVVELYVRMSRLLEVLPVDKSVGELVA